jgi:NADH:ubiquinone oxidoreductase subunit B-like Fe-S oxidoreductase
MGLEEKLPSGIVLTSVEKLAGYMRKNSLWPATFVQVVTISHVLVWKFSAHPHVKQI